MKHLEAMGEQAATGYPFPAYVFGVIAIGIFIALAAVTWSYRDVANRHDHKTGDSNSQH